MKHLAVIGALCAAVLLSACATTQATPELDAARADVAQVASDPLAREAAGERLKKAQDALQQAEDAKAAHKNAEIIRQDAYLASREAQIALEQIKEARARKEIERGEADRNRVLLEARSREADRAVGEAERAKSEAAAQTARAVTAESQADAARAAADAARAEADLLKQEMVSLQMTQTERGMVLTLGDVLFDTARAELKPGAENIMNRVAEFLHHHTGFKVLVEGHTDSIGTDEYNVGLSQRRADAVAGALRSRGIDAERIRTRGLGKHYPVASNDTAAGRQHNRRVELVFSDDKGVFSPAAERTLSQ